MLRITVDKNDFVVSAMREIERSDYMPEATRICKGPWHYKNGKGTVLPLSMFPENRYRKGTLTKTCGECLEKSGKRSAIPLGVKADPMPVPMKMGVSLEAENFGEVVLTPANGGLMHKWEVTIVKPTVVTVYAKDYLDAGVEAGDGDITNIRRLD